MLPQYLTDRRSIRAVFVFYRNILIERRSLIGGSVKKGILQAMRPSILHFAHHSTVDGHQRERQMYDTLRREYFRPTTSIDAYRTVRHCHDYPIIGTKFNLQRQLQLFPQISRLVFNAIDKLGKLPPLWSRGPYEVIITDLYIKLSLAVQTTCISSTNLSYIYFNYWIIPYEISDAILSDNGLQFVRNFFVSLCNFLRIKKYNNDCVSSAVQCTTGKLQRNACIATLTVCLL